MDVENLIRTGMFGGKTDDTFGQGGFDLEDHLARLGRARKDALLDEEEFEEKIEREDNLAGQSFDERDKRDSRRKEKVKANLKKRKVVDRLKESVPEELKDYFEDEAEMARRTQEITSKLVTQHNRYITDMEKDTILKLST